MQRAFVRRPALGVTVAGTYNSRAEGGKHRYWTVSCLCEGLSCRQELGSPSMAHGMPLLYHQSFYLCLRIVQAGDMTQRNT